MSRGRFLFSVRSCEVYEVQSVLPRIALYLRSGFDSRALLRLPGPLALQ